MISSISISAAPALIAARAQGGRVFVPGGPVEPISLAQAFDESPRHGEGLTFCGMMIPGINLRNWAVLHPTAQAEVFLPSPDLAETIASGKTKVLPLHYSAAYRYLQTMPFKVAIFHVCPPDAQGLCNLSLSADSSPAFLDRDIFKFGIINHALPHIAGAPSVPFMIFDAWAETDQAPLPIAPPSPSTESSAIAGHIAGLVEHGATLQTGIGRLPGAVMNALTGHKNLKLHSGLIGDWALDLLAASAFAQKAGALTAGVILGSKTLHDALKDDTRVSLVPIDQTHGFHKLADIEKFTSINAALEIDLLGQINCEYVGGRTISGVGGALDFLRGARASRGGKPIIMIQSQGKGGVSRIVPRLNTPTISIARSDAPILVTEYGAIDLEPLAIDARARAIISLSAPSHRDDLERSWREMRK